MCSQAASADSQSLGHEVSPRSLVHRSAQVSAKQQKFAVAALQATLRACDAGCAMNLNRAVRHPNGFLKIPLVGGTQSCRLFAHVWEDAASDGHIHDHRWDYESIVLAGVLSITAYQLVRDSSGEDSLYVAQHVPCDGGFLLRDLNAAPVAATPVSTIDAECTLFGYYSQAASLLHKVDASAGTVTFVARGAPRSASSRVLLPERATPGLPIALDVIDDGLRNHVVRSLIRQLVKC